MRRPVQRWIIATILLAIAGACVSGANLENDDGSSSQKADAGTTKRDAGKPSASNDDDEGGDDEEVTDEGEDDGSYDESPVDAGVKSDGGKSDAGKADAGSALSAIKGSAKKAGCSSTQAAEDGMCSSHFCGITEEQLASASDPESVCGPPATACEEGGRLAKSVTDCSIQVKATNFGKTNEQLRPLVQACVYKDAEIKAKVNTECLGCFLAVAECAGEKCLVECLTGSPAVCDKCRIDKGCEAPLFECAGLPNPL
jgi:hypothetical protein